MNCQGNFQEMDIEDKTWQEKSVSLKLYNFLCDKIGSEEAVKTRRKFNETHNALTNTKTHIPFFSGSRGEGLDMKGSDTDTITILEDILIVEEATDDCNSNTFKMEIDDDNPGFARLKLCSEYEYRDVWCINRDDNTFLSSDKMKKIYRVLNSTNGACVLDTVHGPCISTRDETYDCTADINLLQHRITLPNYENFKSALSTLVWPELFHRSSNMIQIAGWKQPPVVVSELIQLNEVRSLLLRGQAILKTELSFKQLEKNCDELDKTTNKNLLIYNCLVRTLNRNKTVCFNFEDNLKLPDVLPFALKGEENDAISGRNVIATFYYCSKDYLKTLHIMENVLKEVHNEERSNAYLYYQNDTFNQLYIGADRRNDLSKIYVEKPMEPNDFYHDSALIPDEMKYEVNYKKYVQKPPIVYSLFLRFLCLLKLKQTDKCLKSLSDL
ncbi:unnamed protein product [Mytilus coruscus]|uniref:Uncharacterized protein n=1 Tax=Mytilus coruscus TaxID=42192 RepID=A0A6J8CTW0_MYTCO|nr:unnamed protein product [Mytilus coruscus]